MADGLSDPLALLLRIGQYNPEREIVFMFADWDALRGQALILAERADGVPVPEDDPDELPPLGQPVPPIVSDHPDPLLAKDYDHLLDLLGDRVSRHEDEMEGLTPDERTVWDVVELMGEVDNGGISQFFVNSGHYWREMAAALERVGAAEALAVFRKACAAMCGGEPPPDDLEDLWDAIDESPPDCSDALEEADQAFYALEEELPGVLWAFWQSVQRRARREGGG